LSKLEFAALHCHGDTSFLDGRARHEEIVAQAIKNGDVAVSLTDHDEVNGQIAMQTACQAAGLHFIPGTEARWVRDIAASREAKTSGLDNSHMILLAQDQVGLRNMWTLSSLAYEAENFYGKPQLNPNLMREYSAGLWASDGCGLTRFAGFVELDELDEARKEWGTLLDIYGDHFYSELHTFQFLEPEFRPLTAKEKQINAKITKMNHAKVAFAQEMGVPLVVVNDSHYAQEDQWEQHRLVFKMSTYKKDQDEGDAHAADWMMTTDEIIHYMSQHGIARSVTEEAIKNTAWIASQCHAEIKPNLAMPRLYATDEEDAKAFQRTCDEGFKRFILDKGLPEEIYRPRLEREMALIVDQGMPGYFNVVADYVMAARNGSYIKWAEPGTVKNKPCLCGPGRGSGGGSLVNYVLGITSIDPIHYNLSFERFINPDRPDYPDIDVDFQKSHRQGLIAYMGERYGHDKVVAIGTKSRSGPKKTLIDLCKALGVDFKDANAMSKLIAKVDFSDTNDYEANPDYEPPTWEEVLEEIGGELTPYMEKYKELKLFQRMEEMVGLCRQAGVHAAGILMLTDPVFGLVPTRRKGGKGVLATQFDMNEIAWMGGVKDDFLSNKGLDVLAMARDMIYERHGKWIDYDGFIPIPKECPPENVIVMGPDKYADPAIWGQIDAGHTAGIFQINTAGGTKQAIKFKPRSEKDLSDLVAINRPGVIRAGLLNHYLDRRNGDEEITYDHPLLETILGPTMGILVYQEDLVEACLLLAGFTKGQGETLRKAIGKKKLDLMQSFEKQFIDGCMANEAFTGPRQGSEATARKIWNSLLASAAYAFNKAHSVGYAMQANQETWVKHYYFDEFITSCLAVYEDAEKTATFIRECRRKGRPIMPPDVNKSGEKFTLADDGIRYGLTDINGIGDAAMPDILNNRPFADLPDYLVRTTKSGGWKKGVVDNLVKIGAFDWTGQSRSDLLDEVYYHWARMEIAEKKRNALSVEDTDVIVFDKWRKAPAKYPRFHFEDPAVVLEIEKDLMGTFITVDPMGRYVSMIEGECIQHPSEMEDFDTGHRFVIGGEITRIHTHMQRNNQQMAFITMRWAEEDFEFLAFADAFKACKQMLKVGAPAACEVIKLAGGGASLSTVVRLDWMLEEGS
jgi:DNA polymerase-3 subunit alpha